MKNCIVYIFAIVFLIGFPGFSNSQTSSLDDQKPFLSLSGKYIGQMPPGLTPKVFAPGIVSTKAYEFAGTFSPDGKEFVFTRRPSYEGSANRLMYTQEKDGIWTKPVLAPFAKDLMEFEPFISPDGRKLFFGSERAHPVTGQKMVNNEKIWISERTETGWGDPMFLDGPINDGWVMNMTSAKDGTLYFCGDFAGKSGIFKSEPIGGKYETIDYLFDGVHPFISPDRSYIIFDSFDESWEKTALFISVKDESGNYLEAKRMCPEINQTDTESHASVSADGEYLFFHREGDIYWVDSGVLDTYISK